jgi:hypothetical protein
MLVNLLNGALTVELHFENNDSQYDDNICLCFKEPCPEEERVFKAEQTLIYIKSSEARALAKALLYYAEKSDYQSLDAV